MEVEPTGAVEEVGHTKKVKNVKNVEAQVDATPSEEIEVGGVRETLTEALGDDKPSFTKSGAEKTGP